MKMKWWTCECILLNEFVKYVDVKDDIVSVAIACEHCGSSYQADIPFDVMEKYPGDEEEDND